MGKELWDRFPREVEQADDILGYSIRRLCLEDPNSQLKQTEFTQPALYVVCVLAYLNRLQSGDPLPSAVAGHSLGEYAALYAAGAFDFATGLRLVSKRGVLMAQVRGGGMVAILGLTADKIASVLARPEFAGVEISNNNSPSQFVISGPVEAVQEASRVLEESGAKRCVQLQVSGAFHSQSLRAVAATFRRFIDPIDFQVLRIPVVANVTACPYPTGQIHDLLASQISSPVRWTESVQYLLTEGATEFVEVGPGNQLTGMVQQIRRNFS
jgi:malonyl CoA-acyl carrier protein transacylase